MLVHGEEVRKLTYDLDWSRRTNSVRDLPDRDLSRRHGHPQSRLILNHDRLPETILPPQPLLLHLTPLHLCERTLDDCTRGEDALPSVWVGGDVGVQVCVVDLLPCRSLRLARRDLVRRDVLGRAEGTGRTEPLRKRTFVRTWSGTCRSSPTLSTMSTAVVGESSLARVRSFGDSRTHNREGWRSRRTSGCGELWSAQVLARCLK